MPDTRPISKILTARTHVLGMACATLAIIVAAEWYFKLDYSLGLFYVLPVLISASVLNRWQSILASALCAGIRSLFLPELTDIEFWLRWAMAFLAYSGAALFIGEVNRNRRLALEAYTKLKVEKEMRHQAEDQLRLLAEGSPAAILTLNHRGEVLAANRSASDLLGAPNPESLLGKPILDQVPVFGGALRMSSGPKFVRTSAAGWAQKIDGVKIPVASWFSTYGSGEERCLAGILVDMSEEVRDRDLESFRHFGEYNRMFAGAVSHEIRNMCLAIRVVISNLRRKWINQEDADLGALSTLSDGLGRMASFELEKGKDHESGWADLRSVFEELRVVIEPDWTDAGGAIEWDVPELPTVHADVHSLLQVFMNLSQNSLRASQFQSAPSLQIKASVDEQQVTILVTDGGCGVQDPAILFQPFRAGADGSGLGLYISRAIMRSFGGDLKYIPTETGCQFEMTLPLRQDETLHLTASTPGEAIA